jgi:hypothetical protein
VDFLYNCGYLQAPLFLSSGTVARLGNQKINMKALTSFEMLVPVCQTAWYQITEEN